MAVDQRYLQDVEEIFSHSADQGGALWTTPDKRLFKGGAWSALGSASLLLELGMEPGEPVMKDLSELFFGAWKEDGRFKVYPKGSIFPCETALCAQLLCRMGYVSDPRIQKTLLHLLEIQYTDGGLRCNKFYFGRGPETECSNPFPTLNALDAFRYSAYVNREGALDRAVDFLLAHWTIREPIGPCHYGMGTRFMQVEYPFDDYNLFIYVYVLSFYDRAKKDPRFLEALKALEDKLADGQVVVERVHQKYAKLTFCEKGRPSELATRRYREILENLG